MKKSKANSHTHTSDARISSHCPRIEQAPDFTDGSTQHTCEGCDTTVHNLTALTQSEATDLLRQNDGICIRYATQEDGSPQYRRAPTHGLRPALAGVALSVAAACGTKSEAPAATPIPAVEEAQASPSGKRPQKVGRWGKPPQSSQAKAKKEQKQNAKIKAKTPSGDTRR